jgi:nucleotide-binding universal stress UspA family protein
MPPSPELDTLKLAFTGARKLPAATQGVQLQVGADGLEDAALLEENLRRLEDAAGLSPLPPSVAPVQAQEEYALRVRAVRTRLDSLGYADVGDLDSGKMDVKLLKALHRFREEAGLPRNVGIDPPTWDALQELVALEPPFQVDRWVSPEGKLNPVLTRAVQLRLTVLGMRDNRPVDSTVDQYTTIPLDRFRAVVSMLGLADTASIQEKGLEDLRENRALIALLFDHDVQLDAVAEGGDAVRAALKDGLELNERTDWPSTKRYLLRLVRAELWLNGYPIGDIREPVREKPMRESLQVHWRHVAPTPLSESALRQLTDRLRLETLQEFSRQQREPEVSPEELAAFVKANEPALQDYWTHDVPNSGFFLWDGLRRAARWLGRQVKRLAEGLVDLVRRGVDYAVTLVKNVFRALFQKANEVLTTIRKAATAFVDGVGLYLKGELREGTPNVRAACRFRPDGDADLLVLGDGGIDAAKGVLKRMERVGLALQLAASVLSLVIGLVASAARGLIGWISLIAQLVRVGPRLHEQVLALAALA